MLFRFPAILLTGSVVAGGISAYLIPRDPGFMFFEPNSFVEELQLFEVSLKVFFWLFIVIGPFVIIKGYTNSIRRGKFSLLKEYNLFFWNILFDLDKLYRFFLRGSIFFIGIGFGRFFGCFLNQVNLSLFSVMMIVSGISLLIGVKMFMQTNNKKSNQ